MYDQSLDMTLLPNKSPEPTAVGAVSSAIRGSRRESAVAQLFSLGCIRRMTNRRIYLADIGCSS